MKFLKLIIPITIFVTLFYACNKEVSSRPNFIFKPAPKAGVAAKFGDVEITNKELMSGIESDVFEAEMKIHEIKMNRLRALILEKLINGDKRKKGLSNDEFLEKYIAKGKDVSDKDIDAFVKERNIPKQHMNDQMKARIKAFLSMDVKRKAVEEWMGKQTSKKPVEVYIQKPLRPVFDVSAGNAPFYGNADAKVTIIEFSDFQCPFCAKGYELLKEIKKKYGKKVKIAFKQYPLPNHNHAKKAAEASLCAADQNKFWNMHDHMFQNQTALSVPDLKAAAKKLGLDSAKFDSCLDKGEKASLVNNDMEEGRKIGVKSTPTFYVNGQLVEGARSIEVFSEIIDSELKK